MMTESGVVGKENMVQEVVKYVRPDYLAQMILRANVEGRGDRTFGRTSHLM